MATNIINPAPDNSSSNNGIGLLVGAVIVLVLGIVFFVYGLPLLRGLGGNGGIQINVPKNIDVNVHQSK